MMNMTMASREARISWRRARKERNKAVAGKVLYVIGMLLIAAIFLVVPFNFSSVEFGVLAINSGSGKSWLDVLLTFEVSSLAWICSLLYALVAVYAAILAVYALIRIIIWIIKLILWPIIIILMVLFDFLHGKRRSRMEQNTIMREKCEKAFNSIRKHGRLFSWLFRMGAVAILIPSVLLWEDKGFDKLFDGPGLMLIAFFAVSMIFHFICRSIHGRVRPVAIYEVGYSYEIGGAVSQGKSQTANYARPKAMISREGAIIEARDREKGIGRYLLRNFLQNIFGFVMLVLFVCASNIKLVDADGALSFNLEIPQMLQAILFLFLVTRVLKHMTWSFEYDFDGLDEWIRDKRTFNKIACVFIAILGILSGVMLGFDGLSGILLVIIGALGLIEFIIDCKLSSNDDEDESELEEGEFTVNSTPDGMYGEHQYHGRMNMPKMPDTRYNEYNCIYDDDWDD